MKKFYTILLVLFTSLIFSQSYTTRYNNSWRFGMNMGGMWQVSDMKAYAGIAGGLTLEKGFCEKESNFFSLALKLRWLSGRTYGYNFNRNYDIKNNVAYNGTYDPKVNYFDSIPSSSKRYVYDNYRTPISEGALELQLEFNKLRQKTHVILNLWGGVGFSGFRANSNLLDSKGKMYDFSKVDSSGTPSSLSSLKSNLDGSFESWSYGSKNGDLFTFSPSAGIGIGYQFSPAFSMIFEYKVTVPLGANADLLDGVIRGNNDWLGGNNDYYKYAAVNLKFTMGRGKAKTTNTNTTVYNPVVTNSVVPTNTNVTLVDVKPVVNITNPPYSPFNTYSNNFDVKAKVYNVNSRNEIYVTFNGQNISNYSYNFNTKELGFSTNLNIGANYLIITAANKAGSDTKEATINLQGNPPEITIVNPSDDPHNSANSVINVDALIKNVKSSGYLFVKFNGNPLNFFNFNAQNSQFSVQLNLNKGSNILEINATNEFGKDYETQTIIYNPIAVASTTVASRPVTVVITDPATSPYTVKQSVYPVKSKVTGVNSAGQVTVTVNGLNVPFNYSAGSVTFNAGLVLGANYVSVSASNGSSADLKSTIIIYDEQRVIVPPTVVITNPPSSPYVSNISTFTFKAQTKNIQQTNQILAKYNGYQISNYSFNATTGVIEYYTTLTPNANNVFEVKVTNLDGSDNASAIVIYQEVKIDPLITICVTEGDAKRTITIKQSEWPAYQMKGAIMGDCPKEDPIIAICHNNADGSKQNLSIKTSEWASHSAHGDHLGACTTEELDPFIIICHKSGNTSNTIKIKQSEWKTHQLHGDNLGVCITATEDPDITICSKNADGTYQTISIKQHDWPKYQAAGAHLGACTSDELDPSIIICTKNAEGTYKTLTIRKSEWVQYQNMGAHLGACTADELDPIISICHKNADGSHQNNAIKTSEWPAHQAHGDHIGACTADELDQDISICHNNGNGSFSNIIIKQSLWAKHAVHGDHIGACTPDELDGVITICHKNPEGSTQNINIKNSEWFSHAAHGDHKGACTQEELDPTITICHIENGVQQKINIPKSQWPLHMSHGDNLGACVEKIKMISICHMGRGTEAPQTITIPDNEWAVHQAHGDYLGMCKPAEELNIIICSKNPDGSYQTLNIKQNEWPKYQAAGAHLGACTPEELDPSMIICVRKDDGTYQTMTIKTSQWQQYSFNGSHQGACTAEELDPTITICHKTAGGAAQTLNIKTSEWPSHQAHGDRMGACTKDELDPKITICHIPPGNSGNPQTITISQSAWPAHQAHGDHMGACTPEELDPEITICHKNSDGSAQNMNIKSSQWASHASHGDHKGACTADDLDPTIEICHIVSAEQKVVMNIKLSEWATHQAHGDAKGKCPVHIPHENELQICHKKADGTWETIFIKKITWLEHQTHGDYQGPCKQTQNNEEMKNNGGLDGGNMNNGNTEGGKINNGGGAVEEVKKPNAPNAPGEEVIRPK